jgi:hypothetical protein
MLFLRPALIILILLLSACADVLDDLKPSGADKRGSYDVSTTGYHPGQTAPEFAAFDTLNNTFLLSAEIVGADGIVIYFTMWWCPVCDLHTSHMRAKVIPLYPAVKFYFIDYVSGIVSVARAAQLSNGYASSNVLVDDTNHTVAQLYNGTMGSIIVIDRNGVVRMNEYYESGARLIEELNLLP